MNLQQKILILAFVLGARSATAQNTFPVSGNVGVGTLSPTSLLTVNGDISNVASGTYSSITSTAYNSVDWEGPRTAFDRYRGTSDSPAAVQNGDSVGWTDYFAYDGTAMRRVGEMGMAVGAPPTSGIVPGTFYISTADLSGTTLNRMLFYPNDNIVMSTSGGDVGIGTTSPGAKLEVDGSVKLTSGSGASITFPDNTVQSTAWNGVLSGGDYAESVDVTGDRARYEPGDVIVIDPNSPGKFLRSSEAYSTAIAGVYSTKPGVRGRRQATDQSHMKDEVPMAMIGIVPTKVSAEGGPIRPTDLLVTSATPGYAMKGTDRTKMLGAVVGKAMGSLDSGSGVIEVLVTLQ
jgi:hypothetical protein